MDNTNSAFFHGLALAPEVYQNQGQGMVDEEPGNYDASDSIDPPPLPEIGWDSSGVGKYELEDTFTVKDAIHALPSKELKLPPVSEIVKAGKRGREFVRLTTCALKLPEYRILGPQLPTEEIRFRRDIWVGLVYRCNEPGTSRRRNLLDFDGMKMKNNFFGSIHGFKFPTKSDIGRRRTMTTDDCPTIFMSSSSLYGTFHRVAKLARVVIDLGDGTYLFHYFLAAQKQPGSLHEKLLAYRDECGVVSETRLRQDGSMSISSVNAIYNARGLHRSEPDPRITAVVPDGAGKLLGLPHGMSCSTRQAWSRAGEDGLSISFDDAMTPMSSLPDVLCNPACVLEGVPPLSSWELRYFVPQMDLIARAFHAGRQLKSAPLILQGYRTGSSEWYKVNSRSVNVAGRTVCRYRLAVGTSYLRWVRAAGYGQIGLSFVGFHPHLGLRYFELNSDLGEGAVALDSPAIPFPRAGKIVIETVGVMEPALEVIEPHRMARSFTWVIQP